VDHPKSLQTNGDHHQRDPRYVIAKEKESRLSTSWVLELEVDRTVLDDMACSFP